MIITNKLDKSFGPVGSSAGIFILIAGLAATYQSWFGLVLVLLGAFVGFSSTSVLIDFDKRRIKFSNNLFGIIRIGKWISVSPDMRIGIKQSNLTWQAFSRSNRSIVIQDNDLRLVLVNSENEEIMEVMKTGSIESATAQLEILCTKLDLRAVE